MSGKKIIQGLKEAIAHARGDTARVTERHRIPGDALELMKYKLESAEASLRESLDRETLWKDRIKELEQEVERLRENHHYWEEPRI